MVRKSARPGGARTGPDNGWGAGDCGGGAAAVTLVVKYYEYCCAHATLPVAPVTAHLANGTGRGTCSGARGPPTVTSSIDGMTATLPPRGLSAETSAPSLGSFLSPLRVAIVGAGKMAFNHASAIARCPSLARVVAVADPSEPARGALGATAGAETFESLSALLSRASVDVVHIVTPPSTHARLATEALNAGCHVYVEKPFAESLAEADALLDIAAARGLKVCAGHQLLFEPPTRIAARLQPALGRLTHVESYFAFRPVRRMPGGGAPLRADLQLLDILPHPVYLLLHFLGLATGAEAEIVALQLSEGGTVHGLVRAGPATGTLVVTLEGRPVESYVRLVGTNGSVFADYVRGTVQRQIGPGTSGIDKVLAPYRLSRQLAVDTTSALARRLLQRRRSYPGLVELFESFYNSVRSNDAGPVSPDSIRQTTRIWQDVAAQLERTRRVVAGQSESLRGRGILVTGGTGFLGTAVTKRLLAEGFAVRAVARREPAPWSRVPGVEYMVADLGAPLPAALFAGVEAVIHTAAETAGGWEDHQRNSLDATEHLLRAAAQAGVKRVTHVSSVAVLAKGRSGLAIADDGPLEPAARGSGPYVWGKLESEKLAVRLGGELGLQVKVVRPGPLVDYANFDPPGRLGRRIGNMFVAVGSPSDRLAVTEIEFAARVLTWMQAHFDEAPAVLNLLNPDPPTKREAIEVLRRSNPELSVVWLPMPVLVPLSWMAIGLQKVLRPGRPAMNLAKVFAGQRYDTARAGAIWAAARGESTAASGG